MVGGGKSTLYQMTFSLRIISEILTFDRLHAHFQFIASASAWMVTV